VTIRWGDPTEPAVRIRNAVFSSFATQGVPPSPAELAQELRLDAGVVAEALRSLHEAHALVLTDAGDAVRMAHPFSAAPMGYVVTAAGTHSGTGYEGDRAWWGGCAWDSLGIGAALHERVTATTHCPFCGRTLTFTAAPDSPPDLVDAVARIPRPARSWWDDVVATCSDIRTFCDREHLEQWTAARPASSEGTAVPLDQLWALAQPWYGDRLDPAWAPRRRAAAQGILDDVGLTGEFWALP
jgi:hypothetical protein